MKMPKPFAVARSDGSEMRFLYSFIPSPGTLILTFPSTSPRHLGTSAWEGELIFILHWRSLCAHIHHTNMSTSSQANSPWWRSESGLYGWHAQA